MSNTGHQEQSKSKSVDSNHINCVIICNTVSGLVQLIEDSLGFKFVLCTKLSCSLFTLCH